MNVIQKTYYSNLWVGCQVVPNLLVITGYLLEQGDLNGGIPVAFGGEAT